MALASQQTAASFLFSMVRIMRPIRKGRDLPLPTTIFFNEDHPPQTATCRLLPLGDMVGLIAIQRCREVPDRIHLRA
jgi:hypothetical protein